MSASADRIIHFLGAEVAEQAKRLAFLLADNEKLNRENEYLGAQLAEERARAERLAVNVPKPSPTVLPQPVEPVRVDGQVVPVE